MNNIHRSSLAILCDRVHEILQARGALDLSALHMALHGEVNGDQLREACDTLRLERRLQILRDSKSRTTYRALVRHVAPAPIPQRAEEPPHVLQVTVQVPPPAPEPTLTPAVIAAHFKVAPAPEAVPAAQVEAAAAATLPTKPRADRGSVRDLVLQALKDKGPMDRHAIAAAVNRNAQHVSVMLGDMKCAGLVKKLADRPTYWALADYVPPATVASVSAPELPAAINRLQEKDELLARLQPLVNQHYADLLGEIRKDLTGVAA